MKLLGQLIKELGQVIIILWIVSLVAKLFFIQTLLGKIVAVTVKDIYMFIRVSIKMTRRTGRACYKTGQKVYKYLDKKLKSYEETKVKEKQVVNGSNVINLNTYKKNKKIK